MRRIFRPDGDRWVLELDAREREILASTPALIDAGGDAGGRLDYTAHPDDPAADDRYRELLAGELDTLRMEDRSVFADVAAGEPADREEIAAFMRVVGEARLVLASQLGIDDDGWEFSADRRDPRVALLGWLGYLQESAVALLID